MMLLIKFILLFSLQIIPIIICAEIEVEISQGKLQGANGTSRDGRNFYKFLGIPYGKVEKRFEISKPADGWTGVKKVVEPAPGCINSGFFLSKVEGTDDCLTLDIYTPLLPQNETNLLPVMVWIYGGGFVEGKTSEYSGEYFMDQNVVLVMINYRLGAFGFLNAGVKTARGNQGLKDQVLGLKWVQSNIHTFNGNKEKVTIFGESAGSVSVSWLTFSPMAKGLFHRAIMQSGPATIPFATRGHDGLKHAKELAQAMDCPSSDANYLVECLRRIDPKFLAPCGRGLDEYGLNDTGIIMGPSIETYNGTDKDIFLMEDPYLLAKAGKFHKVPMIMGLVSNEFYAPAMSITNNVTLIKKLNAQWGRRIPGMMLFRETAEDPALVSDKIRKHFLGGQYIAENSSSLFILEHMLTERHCVHPLRMLSQEYAKHADLYLYNFTHHPPIIHNPDPEISKWLPKHEGNQTHRAPSHADDIPYFFEMRGSFALIFSKFEKNHPESTLSRELVKVWAEFAKTGKPGKLWGSLEREEWTKAIEKDVKRPVFLQIDDEPKLLQASEEYANNEVFWNELPLKEYGMQWKF